MLGLISAGMGIVSGLSGMFGGGGTSGASGATALSNQASGMASTLFGEQQGYAGQLQSLMANPSSITSQPWYNFDLNQGLQALTRQGAAGGYLGSGNMSTDLLKYATGYASNAMQGQEQFLASISGLTQNPASYMSGAITSQNAGFNQASASQGALGAGGSQFLGGLSSMLGGGGGGGGGLGSLFSAGGGMFGGW